MRDVSLVINVTYIFSELIIDCIFWMFITAKFTYNYSTSMMLYRQPLTIACSYRHSTAASPIGDPNLLLITA